MPLVWRAADVDRRERDDSFTHLVSESIVPYGDPRDLLIDHRGEVHTAQIGLLRVVRFRLCHGAAVLSSRLVPDCDPEFCKIDVTLLGDFAVEQSDRQAAVSAGRFAFVDLSRPHRVVASRADSAAVMFPRALLPLRDKDIADLAAITFDGTQPGSALVASVVREMVGNLAAYEGLGGARIAESVFDLISATLATRVDRAHAVPAESRQRALVLRIRAFIDANLGDPDLAPPLVAARHHISRRHLHKLFEREGTTVSGLIRARRLARCRADLLDPAQAAKPVSSIAARWGIRDAAYFSRVFQAEYGMTPGEYRRRGADRVP
jgi:AraC-like DNA-binding protein